MNLARKLVQDVQSAGGTIVAAGDKLKLSAPAPLPDRLIDELRLHKAEVIGLLAGSQWGAADWLEFYNERAGILEFDHAVEFATQIKKI